MAISEAFKDRECYRCPNLVTRSWHSRTQSLCQFRWTTGPDAKADASCLDDLHELDACPDPKRRERGGACA